MKKTILSLILSLAMLSAMAQDKVSPNKKFQLGIGLGAGMYTDDASVFNASFEIQGEARIANKLSFYGGLAYNRMITFESGGGSVGYGSFLAGPRLWISKRFFIGTGAGVAFYTDGEESNAVFNYDPHIGLNVKKTQFTLGYNNVVDGDSNVGFVQLRAILKLK